jgi:hypothetical protein
LNIGFPFRAREDRRLPAPYWTRPNDFDQATMGSRYDYVLTRGEPADGSAFKQYAPRVPLIAKEGDWRLYASRGIQ